MIASTLYDFAYTWVMHILCYWVLFSGCEVFLGQKQELFDGAIKKINPKAANPKTVRREMKRTLLYSSAADAFYAVLIHRYGFLYDLESTDKGMASVMFDVALKGALIFFWGEAHFYFTHRLLHWGPLMKNVHSSHHESHNPGPWSSLNFHPIEAIVYFSSYLIACLVAMPTFLFTAFKVGMVLGPLHSHVGYEHSSYIAQKFHYLHHTKGCVNYGAYPSGFWDRWMGTETKE